MYRTSFGDGAETDPDDHDEEVRLDFEAMEEKKKQEDGEREGGGEEAPIDIPDANATS